MRLRSVITLPILIAMMIIASLSLIGCSSEADNAVAKVNDKLISKEEFNNNFEIYKKTYEAEFGPDIMSQDAGNGQTIEELVKERILDKLIIEEIIVQAAEKENIVVSKEEIDKEISDYKGLVGGEEKFQEFLKNNNMTKDYFTSGIKKEMTIQKYQDSFISELIIEEEEIKNYYNQNPEAYETIKASHILVETEEEAKDILNQLKSGADFKEMAKKSIEPGAAESGGDLGYFGRGEMVAEFEEVAFALEPGELSDVVQTKFGYHIIKVEEKLNEYGQLKDKVLQDLQFNKYDDKLEELRAAADVEILLEK